eukprot:2104751-Prymnesium_polylepis.1
MSRTPMKRPRAERPADACKRGSTSQAKTRGGHTLVHVRVSTWTWAWAWAWTWTWAWTWAWAWAWAWTWAWTHGHGHGHIDTWTWTWTWTHGHGPCVRRGGHVVGSRGGGRVPAS